MTGMPPQPRIALVTYAMHCGGLEAFVLRLGGYLCRQGYEVEVITTLERGEWFGRVAELGMKASHVPRRLRSKLARGAYDVIFLNHSRHAQACIAGLPEDTLVIPVLHNDYEEIYRVGCANADAWNVAVAVSPKVAETACRRVPGRPVVQILSGVDLPDDALLAQRRAFEQPIRLIFLGRLQHEQKGVLWLPDILQRCLDRELDVTLTIVGDGPDAEKLQSLLSARSLEQRSRLIGGVPPDEVYGLLTQAHVLLLPSQFEGLPIALLESLACGCVPVISRLPGITDVAVVHGETGLLVEPGDIDGYADSVATLGRNPAQWTRLSRAGRERARNSFSVEAMGDSYLRLIRDARRGQYPLPRPRRDQLSIDRSLFTWHDFVPGPLRRLGIRGPAW